MKIVTLNTWGTNGPFEKRFELIAGGLERIAPDIVCLQEVFEAALKNKIQERCGFPHGYETYPAGLVILSRFPFRKTKTHVYFAVSPYEKFDRRAIFTEIEIGGKSALLANTHLSWKAEDKATRLAQVKEFIAQISKFGRPAIATGDFNSTPESEAVEEMKNAGFVELFGHLQPKENGFTWDNARNPYLKTHSVIYPDRRIDLVMVRRELLPLLQPKSCELAFTKPDGEGVLPSDHFGVIAEFGGTF